MKGTIAQKVREIFHQFSIDPSTIFASEEVKLEIEGMLADGTMVYSSATEVSVGVDMYTKDESGVAVPLQAGEYILADGRTVVIGDDAKVAEIREVEEVENELSSALKTIEGLSSRVSVLEGNTKDLLAKLSKAEAENIKKATELSTLKTELSSVKSSAAAPSIKDKSITLGRVKNPVQPVNTKPFSRMTVRERIVANLENK